MPCSCRATFRIVTALAMFPFVSRCRCDIYNLVNDINIGSERRRCMFKVIIAIDGSLGARSAVDFARDLLAGKRISGNAYPTSSRNTSCGTEAASW